MKIIAALSALLLFASGTAHSLVTGHSRVAASAPSWSCDDADKYCENFNSSTDCGNDAGGATNCSYTYLVSENTNSTINFASAGNPSGASGYGALLSDENSSLYGPNYRHDLGSASATNYVQFYFKMVTAPNLNGRKVAIFQPGIDISIGSPLYTIYLNRVSATEYSVLLYHFDNSSTQRISTSSLTNLSLNTWYGIRIYTNINQSSGGISWAIDYDLDGTFTYQSVSTSDGTANRVFRAIRFMNLSDSTTDVPVVKIGSVKISSTGFPSSSVP